jgi:hypothetical protein
MPRAPSSYYQPGKEMGAPTTGAPPDSWQKKQAPAKQVAPCTPQPWQPPNYVETCHPKIQQMMEPLMLKQQGRVSISTILMAGWQCFEVPPRLDLYPMGICWLNTIAQCTYKDECNFASGHLKVGELTDDLAKQVITMLQPEVTAIVNGMAPLSLQGNVNGEPLPSHPRCDRDYLLHWRRGGG